MSDSGSEDAAATVRAALVREHEPLLAAVGTCADVVAKRWDGDATAARESVVPALRDALVAADIHDRLPALLSTAADALEVRLPADPVAAPPYVVVTATGPVVRATLPDVGRVVVSLRVFAVDRTTTGPRYRRLEGPVRETLVVTVR